MSNSNQKYCEIPKFYHLQDQKVSMVNHGHRNYGQIKNRMTPHVTISIYLSKGSSHEDLPIET